MFTYQPFFKNKFDITRFWYYLESERSPGNDILIVLIITMYKKDRYDLLQLNYICNTDPNSKVKWQLNVEWLFYEQQITEQVTSAHCYLEYIYNRHCLHMGHMFMVFYYQTSTVSDLFDRTW